MELIKNSEHKNQIEELILKSKVVIICSGWLYNDGLKLLSGAMKTAMQNESKIMIFSSSKHTQTREINKLKKCKNFSHKILKKDIGKVHTKLYYFEHANGFTALIGSANITEGGLLNNHELSVKIEENIGTKTHQEIQEYITSLEKVS